MNTLSDMICICNFNSILHCSSKWFCAGNSAGEFPEQRTVTRSFDVSLICTVECFFDLHGLMFLWQINGWINNREAGDLRRHRAHYDVTVMKQIWVLGYTSHWDDQRTPTYLKTIYLVWSSLINFRIYVTYLLLEKNRIHGEQLRISGSKSHRVFKGRVYMYG